MRRSAVTAALLASIALVSMPVGTGHLASASIEPWHAANIEPRFELDYHRGQLRIHGHTLSRRHEQRLVETAGRRFDEPQTMFKPLGLVPAHWSQTTVHLIDAIAATRSSTAILTDSRLTIRGVADDTWPDRFESLRKALPESIDMSVTITSADHAVNVEQVCARAATAFEAGPVAFEESGTRFRSSAYPVLERVVALADACRSPTIAITGHSDSTGNEAWNRQLSLARARAVADYIAGRGISKERLAVAGAGSQFPLADNRTRYGRSLNRRIEIQMRP